MYRLIQRASGFAMIASSLCLVGCKASEAPESGFISDPALMSKNDTLPYQKTYWNKKFDPKAYTELKVAAVDTHYVMAQNIWESASTANISKDQIKQNVDELAAYTQ